MKRKVVLTETKLRKVVKNIITEILVNKAYNKFYSDIPEDIYKKLASVDNTKGEHLGPYAKWVIEIYRNGNFDLNNINKAKEYIDVFERVRVAGKLKGVNINNFESLDDMYNSIKDYLGRKTITKGEKIRKKKDEGIERIYEDGEWFVLSLLTFEASLLYGANTKWCTASKTNPKKFQEHIDQGPLYVLINKKTNRKYQFQFETNFFVDELDIGISVPSLKLPDGLVNAITKGDVKKSLRLKYDSVGNFYDGIAKVKLDDKENFININGELLFKQWFDFIDYFKNGLARVKLDDKWNFIDVNGEILFKQWFDWVVDFKGGFAEVMLGNKYNFINKNGELISKQWFDDGLGNLHDGFARVKLNNKWNLINMNGEIIFKQWFDWVGYFHDGFAEVKLDDKWNFIDINGELMFKQWFDRLGDFENGVAVVEINGKFNLINKNGEILFKQWFDSLGDFEDGFAKVKLDDKWNFININGEIIFKQWFDWVHDLKDGFGMGKVNDKFYPLNLNNRTISELN